MSFQLGKKPYVRRIRRIGRNEKCPCGSGKKYKRCCSKHDELAARIESNPDIIKKANEMIAEKRAKLEAQERLFGKGKPMIHTEWQGKQVIAVGNHLFISPKWKTFHDFLFDYLKHEFGKDWWEKEGKKKGQAKHPVVLWCQSTVKTQKQEQSKQKGKHGICSSIMTGPMAAFYNLGYGLYLIRHNAELRAHFLGRLRDPKQFQGARYELFAISTCIRAGFNIELENEQDRRKKHPEFIGFHRNSGQKIAVEAKSRTRPGMLGQLGMKPGTKNIKTRIGPLLNDAFQKEPKFPYVIFVDVNFPPSQGPMFERKWVRDAMHSQALKNKKNNDRDRFNVVIFTNHPHHYVEEHEYDPEKEFLMCLGNNPIHILSQPQIIIDEIHHALGLYGRIPHELPVEEEN